MMLNRRVGKRERYIYRFNSRSNIVQLFLSNSNQQVDIFFIIWVDFQKSVKLLHRFFILANIHVAYAEQVRCLILVRIMLQALGEGRNSLFKLILLKIEFSLLKEILRYVELQIFFVGHQIDILIGYGLGIYFVKCLFFAGRGV